MHRNERKPTQDQNVQFVEKKLSENSTKITECIRMMNKTNSICICTEDR